MPSRQGTNVRAVGRDAGHVHRVVHRAADQRAGWRGRGARGRLDGAVAALVEARRLDAQHVLQLQLQSSLATMRRTSVEQARRRRPRASRRRDGRTSSTRVTRPGITGRELGSTVRCPTVTSAPSLARPTRLGELDDLRRRQQRVAATFHRRRPGVRLDAGDDARIARRAWPCWTTPIVAPRFLEPRGLLDVQLEVGARLGGGRRARARQAEARRARRRTSARRARLGERVVERQRAAVDTGPGRRGRGSAHPPVGPRDEHQRRDRPHPGVVEGAQDLETP